MIINGYEHLPIEQRKKIVFLSDDPRLPSGVGNMTMEIIKGTCHHFNYFVVGAAVKHPDEGRLTDINEQLNKEVGIDDASVKILPFSGYGNPDLIRTLIKNENPDFILHFTDPRFWIWLYGMEHEIRQQIPILYYQYYASVDWFGCISKQTENIVHNVCKMKTLEPWQVTYIPHGINKEVYYPIVDNSSEDYRRMQEVKKTMFNDIDFEFILLYNSRNIRRKMTSDVILSYKAFCDTLPPERAAKCLLILHTNPIDDNGTDLPAVIEAVCPNYRVFISGSRISPQDMNILYNISDVVINLSSNEGWGLSTTEGLMAGVPMIATVTGGLQDQMRFEDENGDWIKFDTDFGSNHDGTYTKCGDWAFPVFPKTRSLMGSPLTPYIFDDRINWEDASTVIKRVYDLGTDERKSRGLLGRQWLLSEESGMNSNEMCRRFMYNIDEVIPSNWKPKNRFDIYKIV